jgi:hypothetical protein
VPKNPCLKHTTSSNQAQVKIVLEYLYFPVPDSIGILPVLRFLARVTGGISVATRRKPVV